MQTGCIHLGRASRALGADARPRLQPVKTPLAYMGFAGLEGNTVHRLHRCFTFAILALGGALAGCSINFPMMSPEHSAISSTRSLRPDGGTGRHRQRCRRRQALVPNSAPSGRDWRGKSRENCGEASLWGKNGRRSAAARWKIRISPCGIRKCFPTLCSARQDQDSIAVPNPLRKLS